MTDTLVFIGTYTEPILFGTGKVLQGKGEGIYTYRLNPSSGRLQFVDKISGLANPSYLALDASQKFLYAVSELKTYEGEPSGAVGAFVVDRANGTLRLLNKQLTHGTDPCQVVVDGERRHVFVANFMSGSVCVLEVREDGSLGRASDFVQHQGSSIDHRRQSGPHAHSVTLDQSNGFVFVPDLGLDKLMIYRFDVSRGMLEPNATPWIKMRPGSGPRHLALHPDGPFAYLVNELDSTVAVLSYDAATGSFRHLQTVSTLPPGFSGENTCADIHVSPSGEFVYASNRGHDSIVIYRIDRTSRELSCIGHESTRGRTPRSFDIDPSGRFLIAANQDSDSIVTFQIDPESGRLRANGDPVHVPTPVCVRCSVELLR